MVLGRLTTTTRGMLVAWVALVTGLAALAYASNFLIAEEGNASVAVVSSTSSGVSLDTDDGRVEVAAGTPAGTYTLVYRLCETQSQAGGQPGCATAPVIVTVGVGAPQGAPAAGAAERSARVTAVADAGSAASTGGTAVENVLSNDRVGEAEATTKRPGDLLYRWSSAIGGLVQYALILGVVFAIARPLAPEVLGLQQPRSWPRAAGFIAAGLGVVFAIGALLDPFLNAGEEQGLVPDGWDSSRAAPFVANFVVVALVAPVVEELTFRGLGFAVIRDAGGVTAAILITGLAFGLAHGLVIALPILACFGVILAIVRAKTDSLYPAIVLHAIFNSLALIVAVTQGGIG